MVSLFPSASCFFFTRSFAAFSLTLLTLSFPLSAQIRRAAPTGGRLQGAVSEVSVSIDTVSVLDTLTGRVQSKAAQIRTVLPVAGARITLRGTRLGAVTDSAGKYAVKNIPSGIYDVAFSGDGYRTEIFPNIFIRASTDTVTEIDITLYPVASRSSEIVVTANRYEQKLKDVASSVSIVSEEFIVDRNSASLDEALRYTSGVSFSNSNINIRSSSGVSFGLGSRVQVMLDNVPFLTPDGGEARWDALPVDFIERVEVVKGAASTLYGSSALGGVVNVITKNKFETRTSALLYGGIYDSPRYDEWKWSSRTRTLSGFEVSHSETFGNLGAFVSLSRRLDESYKENFDFKRWRLFSKLAYTLSPAQSFSLTGSYADDYSGQPRNWLGLDRALSAADTVLRVYSDKLFLAPTFETRLNRAMELRTRGRYYRSRFSDTGGQSSSASIAGAEAQLLADLFKQAFVIAGADVSYSTVDANIYGGHQAFSLAAYLQNDFTLLDILRFTYGFRYDGLSVDGGKLEGQINPRVAALFPLNAVSSARASVGRAYRNATIAERFTTTAIGSGLTVVPNPALQAETSLNYEVGYALSSSQTLRLPLGWFISNISIDASLFWNEFRDLIEPRIQSSGAVQFQNVTSARITGLEVSTAVEFNRKAAVISLSYTRTEPRDLTAETYLPYRNRNLFYLSALFNAGIFSAEWNYRYLSRFDTGSRELVIAVPDADALTDAHISDVRLGARLPYSLTLGLIVRNLFNYNYVEQPASLAPLRHFLVQVRTAF